MKSFLAIFLSLFLAFAAHAAGFGYDPFAKNSPTSAGGSAVSPRPSAPPSQPASPGAQPVNSKQGPNIPTPPAAKN